MRLITKRALQKNLDNVLRQIRALEDLKAEYKDALEEIRRREDPTKLEYAEDHGLYTSEESRDLYWERDFRMSCEMMNYLQRTGEIEGVRFKGSVFFRPEPIIEDIKRYEKCLKLLEDIDDGVMSFAMKVQQVVSRMGICPRYARMIVDCFDNLEESEKVSLGLIATSGTNLPEVVH